MNPEVLSREIVEWLQEQVRVSGGKGTVFGLSGGLDSAVVAALCKRAFGRDCLALLLPCLSAEEDLEHGELVAKTVDIPFKVVRLDDVFQQLLLALGENYKDEMVSGSLEVANLKPRLRMTVLYYHAARNHYRVVGTGNKSEIMIGYFTKYGDGAVDLEPLGSLLKEEVRELAEYLVVPREIINKKPSAGLWEGQTDENEMGFSYKELDTYLKGGEVDRGLQEKIEKMISVSEHKRKMPPLYEKKSRQE